MLKNTIKCKPTKSSTSLCVHVLHLVKTYVVCRKSCFFGQWLAQVGNLSHFRHRQFVLKYRSHEDYGVNKQTLLDSLHHSMPLIILVKLGHSITASDLQWRATHLHSLVLWVERNEEDLNESLFLQRQWQWQITERVKLDGDLAAFGTDQCRL